MEHRIVFGASGVRYACEICRLHGLNADLTKNPKFGPECNPSEEALDKFLDNAIKRYQAAEDDIYLVQKLRRAK